MTIAATACPFCGTASKHLTYEVRIGFEAAPIFDPGSKHSFKYGDRVNGAYFVPAVVTALVSGGQLVQI